MTERAYPQHNWHPLITANADERAQISASFPIPDTLMLLMMYPETVRGNHRHSASLHLSYLPAPFIFWQACIMYLAHHRQYTAAIDNKAPTVYLTGLAIKTT